MTRDLEIRLADERDRAALLRLFDETNAYYGLPATDPTIAARAVDRLLAPGDPRCWIALREGLALGYLVFAIVLPPVEGAYFVKELFVSDAARGAGVGERLLTAAAAMARLEGCVRLDLTTDRANDGAMRFYQRLGGARQDDKAFFRFQGAALADLAEG